MLKIIGIVLIVLSYFFAFGSGALYEESKAISGSLDMARLATFLTLVCALIGYWAVS